MPNTGLVTTVPADTTPIMLEHRPRRAYRGKAFLGFGNIVPVLHGTSIFPLPPKQEKTYFMVANDGKLDHYDGEANQTFVDDIKAYMTSVMATLQPERQQMDSFLNRTENRFFNQEWKVKFPFASHRLHEKNAMHTDGLLVERTASSNYDPSFYLHDSKPGRHALMSGVSLKHGGTKTNKVEIVNWTELETRMARITLKNIFNSVERPDAESEFQVRFTSFRSKVAHFFQMGETWDHPNDYETKIRELRQIDSYNEFEAWIMEPKQHLRDLNMVHEKWLTNGLARRLVTNTQIIRIGHWVTVFFQYSNFKNNRPLVSLNP